MKVAILTMFNGLSSTYSLVNVVAEHLKMLLDAGIETKVLVCEDCPDSERTGIFADERIEWVKVVNKLNGDQIHWKDYSQPDGEVHKTFFEEAKIIAEDFITHLSDVNVCIMHDIHYQGWHLLHNVAIRKAQENLLDVQFIAVTHSAPVNRPPEPKYPFSCRFTSMPNTTYVYPTYSGIPALAKQYDVPEGRCRVIYNTLDIISNMSDDVKLIHSKTDLISPDILIIYPGRLTTGKKFEKVAALAGVIKKKTELAIKVIFCDFPCMDVEPDKYKFAIRKIGCYWGLKEEDMAFTSDLGFPKGFPRNGVFELFTLSNLFICPSYSESFGLTVLEAASRGNFLVLNEAVPALEEIGKKLKAYFMRWDARNFGFDTKENYNPSEQFYLEEHATIIVNKMRDNAVLYAKAFSRQKFSPKWVWYLKAFVFSGDIKNRSIQYSVSKDDICLDFSASDCQIKIECPRNDKDKIILCGEGRVEQKSNCDEIITDSACFKLLVCKVDEDRFEFIMEIIPETKPLLNHNSGVVKDEESTLKFESCC